MRKYCLLLLCGLLSPAWAHQSSDSYVYVNSAAADGRLDISISDLQRIVNLDENSDTHITWQELTAQSVQIEQYVQQRFAIDARTSSCAMTWHTPALTTHIGSNYLAFPFTVDCPPEESWTLYYNILFDRDALHRALVQWKTADASGMSILAPERAEFTLPASASRWSLFTDYFQQGVLHLLIGYDHMLFLLALLLPVVARLITPQATLKPAVLDTLGIVTLFTAAHSCTLALSALGVVQLPVSVIEILIALSVSGAGIVALVPAWHRYRHGLAFGFGLIHGFGFANVLAELSSTLSDQLISLAAFNLGVEAGQALLIGVGLPAAFLLRHQLGKARWGVALGSCSIVACGLFWAGQRFLATFTPV